MKKVNIKHHIFVYPALLFFLFAACYVHWQSFHYPYIGVGLEHEEDKWRVTRIEPGGKAEELGIILGDELVALDGKSLTSRSTAMITDLNQVKTFTFLHQGQEISGKIDPQDRYKQYFAIGVELLLVGIGCFAYVRKPESHLIRKFFTLNMVLAWIILTIYSTDLLLSNVFLAACSIWISYLLLELFVQLIFTKISPVVHKLFATSRVMLACFTLYTLSMILRGQIPGWIRDVVLVQLLLSIGVILVVGRIHWKRLDRTRQNYLLILITGIFISFLPFLFLYAIPDLLALRYLLAPEYGLIGLVPFSATMMYILIKQRMADMRVYIPRIYIHTLFIAGVFVVYLCATAFGWSPLVFIGFLLVYTGGYQWALKWAHHKINGRQEWLEKEKLRLSIQLTEKQNNRELMVAFAEMIQDVINVEGLCVMWSDGHQRLAFCTGIYQGMDEALQAEDANEDGLQQRYSFSKVLRIAEGDYICLGQKRNHTSISAEELQFLEKVTREVAQLLRNARVLSDLQQHYRSSTENPKTDYVLLEAHQSERIQTSYFLHDHILQNLIFLSRDLEELHESSAVHRPKVKLWLQCVYDSQREIRLLCDRLHPHIVDKTDLREAVQWLIRSMRDRAELDIKFQYKLSPDLVLPTVVKTNVFRIIRELINNTVKHAHATTLTLDIWTFRNVLHVRVEDNGRGFDIAELGRHNKGQHHFGLVSIHHQVTYLGGDLDIHSEIGAGVSVHIGVPLLMEAHDHVG